MAHHSLSFARFEESLSRLVEAHQKVNQKQLPQKVYEPLQETSLFKDGDPSLWSATSSSEFLKYCRFSDVESRVWDFVSPNNKVNRVLKNGMGRYKVEIADFSQGALWEIPEDSEIQPLSEVLTQPQLFDSWKSFLQRKWASNSFSNWSRGFLYSGLCFRGKKESVYDIEIDILASCQAQEFASFHWMCDAGEKSRIRIRETLDSKDLAGFLLYDRLVALGAEASVSLSTCEEGSKNSHIVQNTYSILESHASWTHFDLTLPSLWTRHNSKASMTAPGASAKLFGLYFGDQDFYCDHNTSVEHLSKETQSQQIYKGILDQKSEAVFNGGVYIAEGASQSFSEQLNKNLLLSKKSEVHTKPELRIYNDDVKAAHGATVGQLDREQLFYLQSRGLSKDQSWDYLMQGFVGEVLVELEEEDRAFCLPSIQKYIQGIKVHHEL